MTGVEKKGTQDNSAKDQLHIERGRRTTYIFFRYPQTEKMSDELIANAENAIRDYLEIRRPDLNGELISKRVVKAAETLAIDQPPAGQARLIGIQYRTEIGPDRSVGYTTLTKPWTELIPRMEKKG